MNRCRSLPALLLGTALGFALALGMTAVREPGAAIAASPESGLFAEVLARVQESYVEPVEKEQLLRLAARGMVSSLDPHSSLLDASELEDLRASAAGIYTGIGLEIAADDAALTVVAPIEASPAARAGVQRGDVLVAVDGHALRGTDLTEAAKRLRGPPGSTVRLTVERRGVPEPLQVAVQRGQVEVHTVREELLPGGVGYARVRYFSERSVAELRQSVKRLEAALEAPLCGLVLDLRDNPGGALDAASGVADLFLDRGVIVSASGRAPHADFAITAQEGDLLAGAPMVVLVNGGSASAAEIVAGALHDHGRAVLVGRTTFGKGSVQTLLPLSDGRAVKLTTSRYHLPSGASIDAQGLRPDVLLPGPDRAEAAPAGVSRLVDRDHELRVALSVLGGGMAQRMARYASVP
jgi:carboxyl-terminal processing protease